MTWYIIRTEPKKERSVRRALRRQGNAVYMPATIYRASLRKFTGRRPRAISPMFPSYLFVECETPAVLNLWMRSVLDTKHVRSFIAPSGGQASPLKSETMIELRRRIEAYKATTARMRETTKLRKGSEARITTGMLAGKRGEITSLRGKKARILAWLFGELREVEVKTSNLEAA